MSHLFPLGPYHPSFSEPLLIDLTCDGEYVKAVDVSTGFSDRGIGRQLRHLPATEAVALVGHVCGSSSHALSRSLAQAMEELSSVEIPPAAGLAREAVSALERSSFQLLTAATFARAVEARGISRRTAGIRERLLNEIESLTGNRSRLSINVPGGVRLATGADPARSAGALQKIASSASRLVTSFQRQPKIRFAARGLGVLPAERAAKMGITGPNARASGLDTPPGSVSTRDAHQTNSVASAATYQRGDAHSRIITRLRQAALDVRLAARYLEKIDEAEDLTFSQAPDLPSPADGTSSAVVEGPEGQITCSVTVSGGSTSSIMISTPARANLDGFCATVIGLEIGNVPTLLASFGVCSACLDLADES